MTYESHPSLNEEEQNELDKAITSGEKELLRSGYDEDFNEIASHVASIETQLEHAKKKRDSAIEEIEDLEELLERFHNKVDPVLLDDEL